jgi:hypothetical protein
MRATLVALLLLALLGLAAMIPVRADDDGEDDSGDGDSSDGDHEEAEAPKPKAKAKGDKGGKGKHGKGKEGKKSEPAENMNIPLDAITKLPVEPLAMDAAALKDDDRQFDMLPKTLSGDENVDGLTSSLTKATTLLQKMQRDVESEKVWTKNVYDIIQNYQYKYLKTVKDVHEREEKIAKLESLVKLIKQSTLHASVQRELTKASKQLNELVTRAGGSTEVMGRYYQTVNERMNNLKSQLRSMPRPTQLHSDTIAKMKSILSSKVPPKSADAISHLTEDDEEEEEEVAAPKAAAPKPKAKQQKAVKKPKKVAKKRGAKKF